jgi:hypothetical protein
MIGESGGDHHPATPPMIADSAQKPTGHDGFRAESMITHPWRRTGNYPHGRGRPHGYSIFPGQQPRRSRLCG